MSCPEVNETLPEAVFKRQPEGIVRMKVLPVPAAKSVVAPSVMTISPSGVNAAPLVELSEVSAEMLFPPVGAGTVTFAKAEVTKSRKQNEKSRNVCAHF